MNWIALLALFGLLASQSCGVEQQRFGRPIAAETVLSLATLVADADGYLEKTVAVQAPIGSVCQTAGCWCFLEEGQEQLFVSMTTFTLPLDSAGRLCRAEGRLVWRNERLTLLATGIELLED